MDSPSLSRLWAAALLVAGQAAVALHPLQLAKLRLNTGSMVSQAAVALPPNIQLLNLSVPVDHFPKNPAYEPHSTDDFPLRYYLDSSHYKPGGPVFVLLSGESAIEERLPFLQYGIASILAEETGGVGIVLEHRYYGNSFPFSDLETPHMRFLDTDQALADIKYFAEHVELPGLEHADVSPSTTPWILYGGSYAGAVAAFARTQFPDVIWGAISSSGVTEAIEDYWQYYNAARDYSPGDCGPTTQQLTDVVDNVLFGDDEADVKQLKAAFGLEELEDDSDFGNAISFGVVGLQSTHWDPEQSAPQYDDYCTHIISKNVIASDVSDLEPFVRRIVAQAGYGSWIVNRMLNYIGWTRDQLSEACEGHTILKCLGPAPVDTSLVAADYRSWTWQVCTQWGFFQTGAGTPPSQLAMVSRKISLESSMEQCRSQFNHTAPPDIEHINKFGGFGIKYPRLAIIDGERDPWRQATPHASGQPPRKSTTSEPFILIPGAVHHWEEYGVPADKQGQGLPPPEIDAVQKQAVEFVKQWVKDFHTGSL